MILLLPANFKQASKGYKINKFFEMWGKGHGQVAHKSRQYDNQICKRIQYFLQQRFANKILDIEKVVEMLMGYLLEDDKLAPIFKEMVQLYVCKTEKQGRKTKVALEIENRTIKEKIQRYLSKFIKREYAKHKKNVNYIELSDQEDTKSRLNVQTQQPIPKPIDDINQEQQNHEADFQNTNQIIRQVSLRKQQTQKDKEKLKQCKKQENNKLAESFTEVIKKVSKKDSEHQKKAKSEYTERQLIEQTNISETSIKDKDVSDEKQSQISSRPAICRQFLETQQFGHFLFGDQIDRILDVIPMGKNLNEHAALIEWKMREDGFKPHPSIIKIWDVKYFQIKELILFFQKRDKIKGKR